MQKIVRIIIFFFVFVFFAGDIALAQTDTAPKGSGALIATVNIYNARIVSGNGDEIKVAFDLFNREGVQPQVKYAVQIQKVTGSTRFAVAEQMYDDIVTLLENQTITREVSFPVPAYLDGTYEVWVLAMNEQSMPLGINLAGTVTLSGNSFVELIQDTCFLTIGDDTTRYALSQGVDVNATDILTLNCDTLNHFGNSISATPVYTRHYRSSLGKEIGKDIAPQQLSFKAGEKRAVSLIIPLTDVPQSYDTVVIFTDDKGTVISNQIAAHYVIRGKSATVQSVLFDKDIYAAGDIAHLQVFWSAAADAFGESRIEGTDVGTLRVEVSVTDKDGRNCSGVFGKDVNANEFLINADIPITTSCMNPVATISLTDSTGEVLASTVFRVEPTRENIGLPDTSRHIGWVWVILIFLFSIAMLVVAYILKRSHSGGSDNMWPPIQPPTPPKITGVLILMLMGAFALPMFAKADTFTIGDSSCMGDRVYSANLSKSTYAPGESVYASGWGTDPACGNNSIVLGLKGHANGGTGYLVDCIGCQDHPGYAITLYGGATIGFAPSNAGTYYASFDGFAGFGSRWKCASAYWVNGALYLPYTVVSTPSVSISASPNPVIYYTASTLTWSSQSVSSCTAGGGWSGNRGTAGTQSTGNLTSTQTYNIQCTGSYGPAQASVTVTVSPPSGGGGKTQCQDGIDNDGDGWRDYPADPGCASANNDREINNPLSQCSNSIDDEGDGKADGKDPECANAYDNNETPVPDFALEKSNDIQVTIVGGIAQASNNTTIKVDSQETFAGPVTLSVQGISPSIAGITYSFGDNILSSTEYTAGTPFHVTVPAGTNPGAYIITLKGVSTGPALTRTINVNLIVQNSDPQFQNF